MIVTWKHLAAASAAVGSAIFVTMDCSPKLYWYEKFFYNSNDAYRNKTVWIIGASSGIGSELAIQLARSQCQLLILSSRNEAKLSHLAQQCQQQLYHPQCECICVPMDVTDHESLRLAVIQVQRDTITRNMPLDMVILNAGSGQLCPALETEPQVVMATMQANAIWPMILLPILLPSMELHTARSDTLNDIPRQISVPPNIVVTSSIAARLPVPLSASYAAAKAALQHYFLSLASERPDLKIDICCPGPVDTQFHKNHLGTSLETKPDDDSTVLPVERYSSMEETGMDGKDTAAPSSSPLKMAVGRCARLMLASAAMNTRPALSEFWIAQQPVLATLYLQKWFPVWIQMIIAKVGTKRIQMWRDGLDLYDPQSWTKKGSGKR